ncbi:exodeoxyribonuclease III [Moraxella nasicaprae]|uniref:Exodeoxyribonuclease III n=1 Tax=Moraxella nasicaprae TaxID=2904122 RepID=A0ABY6F351_9GAMM|nr:exodeoxyribonuclease III [Moraxella nasicaprae]UXZ04516.1 exodeoxyribonuclease III [Moraxella nasicaprae]
MNTKINKPKSILNKKPIAMPIMDTHDDQAKPIKPKTIAKTAIGNAPKADNTKLIAITNDIIPAKSVHGDRHILRVISINVNGLRAAEKKGFFNWLATTEADVVCMQETRLTHEQWTDKFKPEGWYAHLFPAQKAGYAGTAIYSRLPIKNITTGLGFELADTQGRFITAEFDLTEFGVSEPAFISSLYLPSGSSGEDAQARKDLFLEEYKAILKRWRDDNKSVIVCGDYNIVHKKIDIKNWSGNQKASGCLPHERAWLDHIYDELGYVDTFRVVRKEADVYSWWSNRGQARAKNVGWRIDYHACSPDWKDRTVGAWVYKDEWFSDHAPVIIDYAIA